MPESIPASTGPQRWTTRRWGYSPRKLGAHPPEGQGDDLSRCRSARCPSRPRTACAPHWSALPLSSNRESRELAPAAVLGPPGLLTRGFTPLTPTRCGVLGGAAGLHLRRPVLGRPGVGKRRRVVVNSLGAQRR